MATKSTAKRTTAADIAAAVRIGAIDPSAEMVPAEDAERAIRSAETEARTKVAAEVAIGTTEVVVSAVEHQCGIPGCRHGSAHAAPQPDRQVKLQCPGCGAVARMTAAALAKSGGKGIQCLGDGATFVPSARRTYNRRSQ